MTKQQALEALIEKYTEDYRYNPAYNRETRETEPDIIPADFEYRINSVPSYRFLAADNEYSMSFATIEEIVDVLEEAGLFE